MHSRTGSRTLTSQARRPLRTRLTRQSTGGVVHHQTEQQKRLGVRIHAMSYVATLVILAVVNYFTGSPYWALWIVPGWTIGLFCHWYFVLGRNSRMT
jgi:hypothetical protein